MALSNTSCAGAQPAGLEPDVVARAVSWACVTEIHAMKPGSVSVHSAGHGMTAQDFLASAQAIAEPLSRSAASVGERILRAIKATRQAVSSNTNLGIVLLAAPLAHAALRATPGERLRERVKTVLAQLDVADATLAYRAIRLANPGGLGQAARHDVREVPRVTLLEAMREAAARDTIAGQYVDGYRDVFERGVVRARQARARGDSDEWIAVGVYLEFLAHLPDTLLVRKFGAQAAAAVMQEAAPLSAAVAHANAPDYPVAALAEFDRQLKARRFNPGTSADLAVASLLAMRLEDALAQESDVCGE
ncbi:MAG TPA: triphosphoribosyl-dephospho-CoA synthase [Burkholderiales bacterium]|nr:triphosphoribosyl-dephospho-CoA synthase [Burkholderiales bacterium]